MAGGPWFMHGYVKAVRSKIELLGPNGDEKVAQALKAVDSSFKKMHRSTVNRWMNGTLRISASAVPHLATFLKLAEECSSREKIVAKHGPYWSGKSKGTHVNVIGDDFLRALNMLGPSQVGTKSAAEEALSNLFDKMDGSHFVVVTTQSVPPAGFKPIEYAKVVNAVHRAMNRGALVAYITPSNSLIDHLHKLYKYGDLRKPSQFRSDFAEFVKGYVKWRGDNKEEADPKSASGMRTQLFEWSDFPMTPCGRTVSLVGESRGFGTITKRILERNPGTSGEASLIPENGINEERLKLFIAHVINSPEVLQNGVKRKNLDHFAWFVQELTQRMNGNPNGHPDSGGKVRDNF